MKRKITSLLTALLLVVFSLFFVSCKDKNEVKPVAIDLTGVTVQEGTTLLDVMNSMREEGELTFQISDGMISAINGTKNSVTYNPCWMLYTSDDDPTVSNSAWGTYEYKGQTFASAAVGAESLFVKTGEVYLWVYTSF